MPLTSTKLWQPNDLKPFGGRAPAAQIASDLVWNLLELP
jgi:hypothetical protein